MIGYLVPGALIVFYILDEASQPKWDAHTVRNGDELGLSG
jgi:hypothetical protein